MQESGKKVNLEVEKIKTMYKNKLREANDKVESLRMVGIRIKTIIIIGPFSKYL